jgi:hypothetical protein
MIQSSRKISVHERFPVVDDDVGTSFGEQLKHKELTNAVDSLPPPNRTQLAGGTYLMLHGVILPAEQQTLCCSDIDIRHIGPLYAGFSFTPF